VPGSVRGMFALHARYGRLAWEGLLLPAERLARFGNPVSRALARRMKAAAEQLRRDPDLAALFAPNGEIMGEGKILRQIALAATLARVRLRGPGDFYVGDIARVVAIDLVPPESRTAVAAAFRDYRPVWGGTEAVEIGNHELNLAPGAAARAVASAIGGGEDAAGAEAHVSPASTGFAAIDRDANAVACAVTANGPFGAARMIGGTGMIAARPAPRESVRDRLLAAVFVNRPRSDAIGALTAGGEGDPVRGAVNAARIAFDDVGSLAAALAPAGGSGSGVLINLMRCPTGIRIDPAACRFAVDPRSDGLAAGARF